MLAQVKSQGLQRILGNNHVQLKAGTQKGDLWSSVREAYLFVTHCLHGHSQAWGISNLED
jgi:hypothetical protein